MSIITVIVGMTILFEMGKDALLEAANEHMKPIVRQMFQELTILGFLSLFVFLLSVSNVLEHISGEIFGQSEEGKDYLTELIEITHYLIFLIMGLNIFQVVVLIFVGNNAHERWIEFNEAAQNEEFMQGVLVRHAEDGKVEFASEVADYFSGENPATVHQRHVEARQRKELLEFYSLRKEFIIQRSPMPPHAPMENKKLPNNFDFAHYQSECLSEFLCDLIELTWHVWAVVWLVAFVFVIMIIGIHEHSFIAPLLWVTLAYLETVVVYYLHMKNASIVTCLVNPADFKPDKDALVDSLRDGPTNASAAKKKDEEEAKEPAPTEEDGLIKKGKAELFTVDDNGNREIIVDAIMDSGLEMPAWTLLEGNKVSEPMCGGEGDAISHRHHQLFWFDSMGPEFNVFAFKTHLVLQAIYAAVFFIIYVPAVFAHQGTGLGIFYIFLGIIPPIFIWATFYRELVVNTSLIQSAGLLIDRSIANAVIRKQKAKKAISLILMLTKLNNTVPTDGKEEEKKYDPKDPHIVAQSEEISEMFDHFDKDNDGIIHRDELGSVLESMGMHLNDHEKEAMVTKLDADGDGDITKDEFTHWMLSHRHTDEEEDLKQTAKRIFQMFDTDGGGTVSVEEFQVEMNKLNSGMDINEITALVREFDTDGDGEISLEEFEKVIESAYE
jgi:calmodulin